MQKKQNRLSIFTNGLVKENPLLVLSIGLCSSLAVTTNVFNGIGMGFSMMFVLVMSELIISIFRNMIPEDIRLPIFIIVIAAFTTIVQLLLEAYIPSLSASLGVFLPLIVVNCIIMGRVESFASKEGPLNAVVDAFGMGFGYTWVLCAISIVRELLGSGSLFGKAVIPEAYTVKFLSDAPGGFFVFGLLSAVTLAAERAAKIGKAKAKGGAA
ncbi:electron transport complex subunit RsxE [Treponema socranskii]|uniref:electron transport complex subunit RsxE n=1 Tax=Treponema socranskii TaxID=53419 RepID=UPI0028714D5E|nr:electron transport complex subunit RsxE [Treponema socranskii]MDR9859388.1 electron transport complex subunit RsxE [Treponema socranskii]